MVNGVQASNRHWSVTYTPTQYKRTGHWGKYKDVFSRLYFSAISKYYSQ